jgi:acyl-CoA dehydrogenase
MSGHAFDADEVADISAGLSRFIRDFVLPREAEVGIGANGIEGAYLDSGWLSPEVVAARREIRVASSEAGFYTMFGHQELGGAGLPAEAAALIVERMNVEFGPPRALLHEVVIPSPFTNGLTPILRFVQEQPLAALLPALASGEKTMCFALSEPEAGSDARGIRTVARAEGDGWVLSGSKLWITNGAYADWAVVFALTDPERTSSSEGGISAFLVDTSSSGFSARPVGGLMGESGSDVAEITLEDVRVGPEALVGVLGKGLDVALHGIDRGRLMMSAACVGQAQWALNQSLDYAESRVTFGRRIFDHQAVQMLIANAAMQIFAARAMVLRVAEAVDRGETPVKELSIVKAFSTEMLFGVGDTAIQVHGAIGLTNELGIERVLRHARTLRIPDGTGEIQRRTVARQLRSGNRTFI